MREIVPAHAAPFGRLAEEMIDSASVYENYARQLPEDDIFGLTWPTSGGDDFFWETEMHQYPTSPGMSHFIPSFWMQAGERDVRAAGWPRAYAHLETILAQSELSVLRAMVQMLVERVEYMEHLLEDVSRMMLAMSQSYYWTPEWQAKEERADADAQLGRSQQYASVEDAIADLNR